MGALDGIRAKLVRAQGHIETVKLAEAEFWNLHLFEVIRAEFNPKTGRYVLRINWDDAEVPIEWSVIIGEIAHDLRSALDQLVCHLAVRNGKPIDEYMGFPIFLYGPRGKRKRVGTRRYWNANSIASLKRGDRATIKRLQPYHRWNGGSSSGLWILHEIHNADKHRQIQTLASYVRSMGISIVPDTGSGYVRSLTLSGIKNRGRLKNGVKIGEWHPDNVNVQTGFTAQIAFDEGCGAAKNYPITPSLQRLVDTVSETVTLFES